MVQGELHTDQIERRNLSHIFQGKGFQRGFLPLVGSWFRVWRFQRGFLPLALALALGGFGV